MNRSLLTILLIFISLGCIVNESYGWDGTPIAVISGYNPKYVLRYENLPFDGGNSHDHDLDEGSYIITDYDWIWPSSAYYTWESPDAGKTAEAKFSPPGEYTVSLKVKDDENIWSIIEQCTVRVVEVSLTGGGYVSVNDDDDNGNGTPDNDSSETTVSGENDLVAIHLSINPDSFPGEMKLTALGAYKDSIRVWKEQTKQTLYIGDGTDYKTWAPDALPSTLWVEGKSPTGNTTQAKLTLLYDPTSHTYLHPVEEIYFTVVKVDINAGLSEQDELDPGKYINVNWDDDDDDGWEPNDAPPGGVYTGDKSDSDINGGDDDLRSFTVSISPQTKIVEDFPNSKVRITFPSKVKVWQTNTKKAGGGGSSELTSGDEFVVENLPKQLYLEGVSGSSAFKDVELKATWLPKSFNDFVKVTVFEVDLNGLFGYGNQQSDNDKKFSSFDASSDKCGKISWDDANGDGTKGDMDSNCEYFHNCMECQGTVKPSGVTNEVQFDIKREKWSKIWEKNQGGQWQLVSDATPWQPDDSTNSDEDLTPSGTNHIYSIDGPGAIYRSRSITDYFAYIGDFKEWVKVKIDGTWYQCSEYYKWHSKCYAEPKDANYLTRDSTALQKLGSGWIAVPDSP